MARGYGRRLGVAAVAALVAVSVTSAAPAAAQAATPRVVLPKDGALVTKTAVRVRVRGAAKSFRVLVGSRDVTKRFTRGRRDLRVARLRRGRDFRLGFNRMVVSSGGRRDAVTFTAVRRQTGMLRLHLLPRRSARAAVHVRARVSRSFHLVRLHLNGKRVPNRLWPRGRRSFEALLGADEGLRFGSNRLVATIVRKQGVYDRVVRRFRIPVRLRSSARDQTAARRPGASSALTAARRGARGTARA